MRPVLFSIGDVNLYSYGLMYALALITGLLWAERRSPRFGLDKNFTFNMGFGCVVIGVVGAKLLHLLTVIDELKADFWGTLKSSLSEGFVVYGGIIAGVLFAYIYCRVKKRSFTRHLDMAVAPIALGQAIGRVGCFLAGCCYGSPTDSWCAVTFPAGSHAPAGVPLIPTQPISALLNLANAVILVIAGRRFKTHGRTGALYMINYGVGRFLIEFFRNDPRGSIGVLSTSQFISVGVFVLGVLLMIFAPRLKVNREEKEEAAG